MTDEGFARRLRRAFRAFEDRTGEDVTQTQLGVLVGKELDGKPITQQSVDRWFGGTRPDHERMIALAAVLDVDPGWLSYGPDDAAAARTDVGISQPASSISVARPSAKRQRRAK